jgi:hypothetical protein
MPAVVAGLFILTDILKQWSPVISIVIGTIAGTILVGAAIGATTMVMSILTFGMTGSVAYMAIELSIPAYAAFFTGIALGLGWGILSSTWFAPLNPSMRVRVILSLIIGLLLGLLGGIAGALAIHPEFGLLAGASMLVAYCVATFRIPFWLMEAAIMRLLSWRVQRRPDTAARLSSWLPLRHDELIYLPLPRLKTYLVQVAETNPAMSKELIALSATSLGQRRVAQRALIEVQARELERVARNHSFARAAEFDLPFFPQQSELESEPSNAPLRPFHAAARNLIAGRTNQHQRRFALERARKSLESLNATTVRASKSLPLAERLLPTVALWLDVIHDEETKLAREITERPQVPSAFVAGPPLTPERAEDRALFRSRADIIRLIAHDLAPDRRGVLLVVGQRRMGKTSLCNWLPEYLGTGTIVVSSNFQPLSGDPHRKTPHRRVLDNIARALRSEVLAPPVSDHWGDGLRWLEEVERTLGDRKVLAVIDEVERVEDGIRAGWCPPDFLDFLRAAGDALRNVRFLLLTAYPLHRLGPHWTDRLVSVTSRTLSYLDESDARVLLTRPIPEFPDIYPEGGVDLILAQTGRHPYLLQKVGDDLCRLLNARDRRTATADDLTEVFDGIISDAHLFDELWRSRVEDEQITLQRLARSDELTDSGSATASLLREGYLERRGGQLAFAVPLFREWIREWKLENVTS